MHASVTIASVLLAAIFGVLGEPPQTAYDKSLARRLIFLAAGAYSHSPNECIKRFPSAHKWALFTSQNETCDSFGNLCAFYVVISEQNQEIYIVFRGTKTKRQLFIEGWQTLQPGDDFFGVGKVNKYFFRAHSTLWDNIVPVLNDVKYKNFNVIFTGHSLGGALASLTSLRAVLEELRRSDQVKLYTYGQPRVGDIRLAEKHDELVPHSFRVVHRLDIVPHFAACAKDKTDPQVDETSDSFPCDPQVVGIAYHHGTEIWYPYGMNESSKYYECTGKPKNEDFHCSDSLSFELSKYETYISDHRHYFDHKVPSWGKLGCSATHSQEEALPMDAVLGSTEVPHTTNGRFAQVAGVIGRLLRNGRRR